MIQHSCSNPNIHYHLTMFVQDKRFRVIRFVARLLGLRLEVSFKHRVIVVMLLIIVCIS